MKSIFLFYGWTFMITFIPWIFMTVTGINAETPTGITLTVFGGIGPALAAVLMLKFYSDKDTVYQFIKSLNPKGISCRWYALVFLLPAALVISASVVEALIYGTRFTPSLDTKFSSDPILLIPFAVFVLFFGPIPEELGWRGYALSRLVEKFGGIRGAVSNGICWAVWHIPLFL